MKVELLNFSYTAKERTAITLACVAKKPWDEECVKDIRSRIKLFHLSIAQEVCCYCQRDLHGEFQMVIDVEHVLPSSLFRDSVFEIWNLGASCKRCNMKIKREKIDFLDKTVENFFSPKHYKFVHPNFDVAEHHLERCVVQRGKARLIKYVIAPNTKGEYTYDYFNLKELEISSFDDAQGANIIDSVNRASLELMRERVEKLLSQ